MRGFRKGISLFLSIAMVLSFIMPFSSFFAYAADTKDFYLVTEVLDYGQRVTAVVIDAESNVDVSTIGADTFEVNAKLTNPDDGNTYFEGARTVTDVYLSDTVAVGNSVNNGKYIVLELDNSSNRDSSGASTPYGGETFTGSTFLDLEYTITQKSDYGVIGGTVSSDTTYNQQDTVNTVVDEFEEKTFSNASGSLNYQMFSPQDAGYTAPSDGYPLVLFLHGGGEKGTDNQMQLVANKGATLWAEPNQAQTNPCYVIAPQTDTDWINDTTVELLLDLIEDLTNDPSLNIDTNRIYVEGMSMGGIGTWNIILEAPEVFAAAMPICGSVPDKWYENDAEAFEALKFMPIWTFVVANDSDALVNGTQKAVDTINAIDGNSGIKFEIWTAGSVVPAHHAWEVVFSDHPGTAYNWLFQQSLTRTNNHTTDPSLEFTATRLTDEVTVIQDYELGQIYVIDKGDDVLIVDTAMGHGDLYEYITNNILTNPNASIDIFITHNHGDHISGLPFFKGKDNLKHVYVHEKDYNNSATLQSYIDEGKVGFVDDEAGIPFAGETLEVLEVPSHTIGSILLFYKDMVFTGDAIGSGFVWLSNTTITYYQRSVNKLISYIEDYMYENGYDGLQVRPGHFENLYSFTEEYIYNMGSLAGGILDGSITNGIYARRNTDVATYKDTSGNHNHASTSYNHANRFGASEESLNELADLIDEANQLDTTPYSGSSLKAFQTALEAAENVNEMTASQDTVDTALNNLKDAKANLVLLSGTMSFDIVTEVFEYGQDTVAVVIDAGKEVKTSSIDANSFSVYASNTSPIDGAISYDGEREVVKAYVNNTAEIGSSDTVGRYIILELKSGFTVTGATTLIYTGSRNYQLNLNFSVNQLKDIVFNDDTTAAVNEFDFTQKDIINLVVDDFEKVEYNGTIIREYYPESSEALPLVLWNHGGGETYSDLGDTNEGVQLRANMGAVAWVQDEYPCYVISPQRGNAEYSRESVIAYINELVAAGKVDGNRIYVIGCSAGGSETLSFMSEYPNYFAAAMPICAALKSDITEEYAEIIKDIPTWFFHSEDDASVDVYYTRQKVEVLESVYPKELKYTEVENLPYSEHGTTGLYQGHWSWILPLNNYYSDEYETNVFDWLFSKKLIEDIPDGASFRSVQDLGVDGSQVYIYVPSELYSPSPMLTPVLYVYGDSDYNSKQEAWDAMVDAGLLEIAEDEHAAIILVNSVEDTWGEKDVDVYWGIMDYIYYEHDNLPLTYFNHQFMIGEGSGATFINQYMTQNSNRIAGVATFGGEMPSITESVALPAYIVSGSESAVNYYKSVNAADVTENATDKTIYYNSTNNAQKVMVSKSSSTTFDKDLINDAFYSLFRNTTRQALTTRIWTDFNTEEVWTLIERPNLEDLDLTRFDIEEPEISTQTRWYEWVPNEVLKGMDSGSTKTYPLVISNHGRGDHPIYEAESNGWVNIAGEEKVIVVAPEDGDEQAIMDLIEVLKDKYPIDESRIYMTGFSMGAMNTLNASVNNIDTFAAIAPMASPRGSYDYDESSIDKLDMPFLYLVGTIDEDATDDGDLKAANRSMIEAVKRLNNIAYITDTADYDFDAHAFWGFALENVQTYTTKHGVEIEKGYLSNDDGIPLMEFVTSQGINHAHYTENAYIAWEFFKLFARDTETKEVIYLGAEDPVDPSNPSSSTDPTDPSTDPSDPSDSPSSTDSTDPSGTSSEDSSSSSSTTGGTSSGKGTSGSSVAKTGDNSPYFAIIILIGISCVIIANKRRRSR